MAYRCSARLDGAVIGSTATADKNRLDTGTLGWGMDLARGFKLTASAGTAERQEFPVDAESQALFTREGRTVSNTNTWAMEIRPGRSFVYELARPGRLFRVEFDLTRPIAAPPAPWGSKD